VYDRGVWWLAFFVVVPITYLAFIGWKSWRAREPWGSLHNWKD
jgi:hypothetical protein